MVPCVSANFAAHTCSALQLLFVPANALANGKEGSLGIVLFKDVQDLVGLLIPWAVIERERNNLVAVAVHVVVPNDVVDRFLVVTVAVMPDSLPVRVTCSPSWALLLYR